MYKNHTGITREITDFMGRVSNSSHYSVEPTVRNDKIDRYQISFDEQNSFGSNEKKSEKIGGLDCKKVEWYFSKVFIRDNKCQQLVEKEGFSRVDHNRKKPGVHVYWALKSNSPTKFETVLTKVKGVSV